MKKKVLGQYTLRPETVKALREHAEKTGHTMSLIVDLAVEAYIRDYKKYLLKRTNNE